MFRLANRKMFKVKLTRDACVLSMLEWLNGIGFAVLFHWATGEICLDKLTRGARTVCVLEESFFDKLGGEICLAGDFKF